MRIGERAQLGVPLGLERVGDQAVLGVDLHLATPGGLDVTAGMLDLLAACSISITSSRLELALDGECDLERDGRDDLIPARPVTAIDPSKPIAVSSVLGGLHVD